MSALLRRLEQVLLPAAPAARPAVLRIATGAYTVWYLGKRLPMWRRIHRTDPALFAPVGPARVLRRPLPPAVADGLALAQVVLAGLFTLGVGHRVIGPLHAALLTWTLSYRNSWSMVFHSDNVLVLHTIALGAGRSADAWSVDALVRGPVRVEDWRYGLPGNLMNALTATTYCLSGVAKVKGPLGWGWADGESLRSQVAADGLRKEVLGASTTRTGTVLYRYPQVYLAMAAGSLALEIGAPLALADRRVGRLWAASAFGMHWGIKAVMGITFRHQLSGLMYLPFLRAERWGRRARR